MPRFRYLCLSLKQLILGLLCLTLFLLFRYSNILIFARISVSKWILNSSDISGCLSDFGGSPGNHSSQRQETTRQHPEQQTTSSTNVTCNIRAGKENRTSCPSCFRPRVAGLDRSFHEVFPNDTFNTNLSIDYFKVRSEIFQRLVTDYLIVPRHNFSSYYLIAVQASILGRRQERDTVRNTWGSVAKTQTWPNRTINAHVKVIFVVARQLTADKNKNSSRNFSREFEEIKSEADLHNDILYLDMIDSYQNLTLKLLSAFKWVKDNCPCVQFVLKVDYDTFVNVPLLVDTLLSFEDRFQFSVLGHIYNHQLGVKRQGKWAVKASLYPMDGFPAYASGCAYVLSYKTVCQIVDAVPNFAMFSVEDAFITGVMRRVVGCRVFTFPRLFTFYLDRKWYLCWMLQDKKIFGMNAGGLQHVKIWDTFVKGVCV